ncbi:MAG: tellurite resistance TerB family protein [Myxococcales bacterium]|nr:tellurite resistance TerB family protein [Myxococcales bacterium]
MAFEKKHTRYAQLKSATPELDREAQEALVEVMTIAACVDGMLESDEAHALARQIGATPGFRDLSGEKIAAKIESIVVHIAEEGIESRLKSVGKALGSDPRTREEAFALATLFVLWDGEVGDEEQEFLEQLQRELHLSDDQAATITALVADAQ